MSKNLYALKKQYKKKYNLQIEILNAKTFGMGRV